MEINPGKNVEDSPYWKVEAGELDYSFRIKLQGLINTYVSHSISSTLNLPKETTEEQVSEIYMQAWKEGLKGITIYREGCRQGVLIEKPKLKDEITEAVCPERDEVQECDIHYSTIDGDQWVILVGFKKGRPFELFGGKKDKIEIPVKYKKGWIRKNGKIDGRRTYDLILGSLNGEDSVVIKDMANVFKAKAGSLSRLISLPLRYGVPIKVICEQLYKDEAAHIFTLEYGLARVLKKYVKDGTISDDKCEKCGGTLKYENGCRACVDCGWSLCN